MKKLVNHFLFILVAMLLTHCSQTHQPEKTAGLDPETEAKVTSLLSAMTLEEKVGQMTQITLDVLMKGEKPQSSFEPLEFDPEMLEKAFVTYKIGSVLNTANNRARNTTEWNRIISTLQEYAIKNNPHAIPVIYGLDMIHGASYVDGATFFPQQIGMAATWNPGLVRKAGEITAYETRAAGISWTFSPVLDLGVDPRWPRQWETFGEDPYLTTVMGANLLKGYQGESNDLTNPMHITACIKHFLGYSHTLSGKDRSPAWIPPNKLREYHMPSFKKAIDEGAVTIMINSGEINGTPVHCDHHILTELIKEEWNFIGFTLSDWSDIEYLHTRHKVAASHKEAVKLAINAGLDMSMVPYNFYFADYLIELVKEGEVSMERIDDAVRRILRVKFMMGLFELPYTKLEDYPEFGSQAFEQAARNTANESITLLKNHDDLLPLSKNTKILVGGPAANTMRPLNGGWSYSWLGNLTDEFAQDYQTIYEAILSQAAKPELVMLYEGVRYNHHGSYSEEFVDDLQQFKALANKADVIVLALGENSYTEKPGDLEDLYLSDNQQQLVQIAAATSKPVILVMVQGRPRVISKIEPLAKGILNAYLPGNFGGEAIANILYGNVNPSGKLPYTYPRFPNSLEPYYIKHAEQLEISGSPTGTQYNPQYHFGFGLSYTQFEYLDLKTDKQSYTADEDIVVDVTLKNTGSLPGMETILVFTSDHFASSTPSVKRLRAFEKVMMQPGSTLTTSFIIPLRDLSFVNNNGQWIVESGDFTIAAGNKQLEISVLETEILGSNK